MPGAWATELRQLMHAAAKQQTATTLEGMTSRQRQLSETLYYMMTLVLKHRALRLLMGCEPGNGFESWRLLVKTLEPQAAGRHLRTLAQVLSPELGANLSGPQGLEERFSDLLQTWENRNRELQQNDGKPDSRGHPHCHTYPTGPFRYPELLVAEC